MLAPTLKRRVAVLELDQVFAGSEGAKMTPAL
jgi:hypothetical protein